MCLKQTALCQQLERVVAESSFPQSLALSFLLFHECQRGKFGYGRTFLYDVASQMPVIDAEYCCPPHVLTLLVERLLAATVTEQTGTKNKHGLD